MKTFIVVAQKALARFFTHAGDGEPLVAVGELEHPESAMPNRALVTDGPGAVKDRSGPNLRTMQPEQTAKEREAENFAREVADRIRDARLSNDHHRAVVVAAPQFLGMLRGSLSDPDAKFVDRELDKNIAAQDQEAIEAALGDVLTIGEGDPLDRQRTGS